MVGDASALISGTHLQRLLPTLAPSTEKYQSEATELGSGIKRLNAATRPKPPHFFYSHQVYRHARISLEKCSNTCSAPRWLFSTDDYHTQRIFPDDIGAINDVLEAENKITVIREFRTRWLDLALNLIFYVEEVDVDQVSRKLVFIAEGVQAHGLWATGIYNPKTVKTAPDFAAVFWKCGMKVLVSPMLTLKSQFIDFLKGDKVDTTVALTALRVQFYTSNRASIDQKLRALHLYHTESHGDEKSDCLNSKRSSHWRNPSTSEAETSLRWRIRKSSKQAGAK